MALGNHIGLPFGRRKGVPKPPVTEVTWNPNVTSNVSPTDMQFYNSDGSILEVGTVLSVGAKIYVNVTFEDGADVELHGVTINGTALTLESTPTGDMYAWTVDVLSPQQVKVNASEYIRFEDIKQPYPVIIHLKRDGSPISWGDKLKVGSEITYVQHVNLLPDLYSASGGVQYNGTSINWNSTIVVEKSMVFTNVHVYKKENEPNCILSNQILPIPNESYKYMGYQPDLSGHGNHGVFNNFDYAGMSGANGYNVDLTTWRSGVGAGNSIITDNYLKLLVKHPNQWLLSKIKDENIERVKFVVTGIPSAGQLIFQQNTVSENIVVQNNIVFEVGGYVATRSIGFLITVGNNDLDWSNLVIQQIGQYEGSICFNGTNNFITIPTLSHGAKQVLMKVNWQLNAAKTGIVYDQRISTLKYPENMIISLSNDSGNIEERLAYSSNGSADISYIDGILNNNIIVSQLKGITHNITQYNDKVTNDNSKSPVIGFLSAVNALSYYAQMALFVFMSFDDISSEEEIKELNDIVGIEGGYVESPDYYWDAYGKNNTQSDDIDNGIKNISNSKLSIFDKSITGLEAIEQTNNDGKVGRVYDRALQTRNFAFNGESGYSEIADTWLFNQWIVYNNMYIEREQINNTTIRITKSNIASVDSFYARTNINKKAYYKITGLQQGQAIQFGFTDNVIYTAESDGVHEVDWSLSESRMYQELGCTFVGDCNITIEQVAQYQNGLVSDGVDDYLINTVIPAFTDFTVIAKRTPLEPAVNSAFLCKGLGYYNVIAFLLEFKDNSGDYVSSFGKLASDLELPESITYMTPTNYNGKTISKGNAIDKQGLCVGMYQDINFWKGVFYKMMLYSKTIDALSINMLKNLFAQDILIDVKNPIFKKS